MLKLFDNVLIIGFHTISQVYLGWTRLALAFHDQRLFCKINSKFCKWFYEHSVLSVSYALSLNLIPLWHMIIVNHGKFSPHRLELSSLHAQKCRSILLCYFLVIFRRKVAANFSYCLIIASIHRLNYYAFTHPTILFIE